jgi:hypothetical protein
MKKLLFGLLFFISAICLNAQTNLSTEIEKLLPIGKYNVDIMELVYPKRVQELSEKLATAIATNKE